MTGGQTRGSGNMIARTRLGDFLWVLGLVTAVMLGFGFFGLTWSRAGQIWLALTAGLALLYFLLAKIDVNHPTQRNLTDQTVAYERLRAVLNALPEPVILMHRNGEIDLANPATELLFGRSLGGATSEGRHISTMLRAASVHEAVKRAFADGTPQKAIFVATGPVDRECQAYISPLKGLTETGAETEDESRVVLVISDLTRERRLDTMRSDFIANASHELRTPLASMMGFIETLRGHAKDDPEARVRFLSIMESQAARMQRLVQDLMSLSAIELNEFQPPSEPVDLLGVLNEVKASMAPLEQQYGGRISLQTDENLLIAGDRDQLIQLVQNLADNALKYAGEPPEVEIRLGRGLPPSMLSGAGSGGQRTGETPALVSAHLGVTVEQLVWVQFRDNGEGIAPDALPRLTERFFRVDVEQSKSKGGTGLGLAIVKHIVNRHQGGLQIESAPGKGSSFTCMFPGYVE